MNSSAAPAGMMLIDKPQGITSFDCIRYLRRQTGIKKIGHAGTLDPMATGLMILLIGKGTKQADQFLKLDKTYVAELTLGATSDTGDAEGNIATVSDQIPTREQIDKAAQAFIGQITQVPPAYSAIKINGQPAYKRIRRGEEVVIPARTVTIYDLKIVDYTYPKLHLEARVSSGTYIRSLAADIGKHLQVGAYLSGLRRTTIGAYSLVDARPLDAITTDNFNNYLMKLEHS